MKSKKALPIGLQDFCSLIRDGFLYVDKTQLIYPLIKMRGGYFFSRPRRFGKSLLLSTLKAIFQGEQDLFQGLWIGQSDYNWKPYPVLSFDFSRLVVKNIPLLIESLNELLIENAKELGIELELASTPSVSFSRLIQAVNRDDLVILIDEYDKPLLKHFDNPELQGEIRELMQDFFVVTKALGKKIHHIFVTGVSKFSKVSLFSGMNNLEDITFARSYATLVGITEEELGENYADWIEETAGRRETSLSDMRDLMRFWYNGYRFSRSGATEKVYNPVSLHFFLKSGEITNYWFGTATPTFAIQMIKKMNYPVENFESGVEIGSSIEEHHEVTKPNLIPMLFQTGYLTIRDYDEKARKYQLSFPNEEVRLSFLDHLLQGFSDLDESQLGIHFSQLKSALLHQDLKEFFAAMNGLLAEIPHTLHINLEAYYHSLLYLILRSLNQRVEAEVMTSRGRLDLIVVDRETIFLFEFKIDGSAQIALDQIIEKGYAERYKNTGKKLILIGVNFDSKTRRIADWLSS